MGCGPIPTTPGPVRRPSVASSRSPRVARSSEDLPSGSASARTAQLGESGLNAEVGRVLSPAPSTSVDLVLLSAIDGTSRGSAGILPGRPPPPEGPPPSPGPRGFRPYL